MLRTAAASVRPHLRRDTEEVLPVKIRELYHRDVLTADPQETVATAAGRMQQEAVGSLAVVEEGRLVGIVTERDLARAASDGDELVGMVSMRDLVALAAWPPGEPART
jgi:predicted transcriptional regulator